MTTRFNFSWDFTSRVGFIGLHSPCKSTSFIFNIANTSILIRLSYKIYHIHCIFTFWVLLPPPVVPSDAGFTFAGLDRSPPPQRKTEPRYPGALIDSPKMHSQPGPSNQVNTFGRIIFSHWKHFVNLKIPKPLPFNILKNLITFQTKNWMSKLVPDKYIK